MTIAKPGRRLFRDVPLPFVRRKAMGGRQRPISASLNLTSMIDFLVVAVVFLLITFDPSNAATAADMKLPNAGNVLDMIDAPMVSLVGSQVIVDGKSAGNTRTIEEQKRIERIDGLFDALKGKRETWKVLHQDRPFHGAVVLQIDQDVPSSVVKSVFQTAAQAGYPNISFMVNREAHHASSP
jgi:biopolymer transport protein ExbD